MDRNRSVTVANGGGSPCVTVPRLLVLAVAMGASFTAVTNTGNVWLSDENAVPPPVAVTAMRPPAVPLVVSHARKVSASGTAPFQLASGTNRMPAVGSAGSSSALAHDGELIVVQTAPPVSVYDHDPRLVSASTTAIPYNGALLPSVTYLV